MPHIHNHHVPSFLSIHYKDNGIGALGAVEYANLWLKTILLVIVHEKLIRTEMYSFYSVCCFNLSVWSFFLLSVTTFENIMQRRLSHHRFSLLTKSCDTNLPTYFSTSLVQAAFLPAASLSLTVDFAHTSFSVRLSVAQMDYSQFSFCVPLSNRQIKDSVFWGQINFPLDPVKWFIIPGSAGTKRRPFLVSWSSLPGKRQS